MLGALERLICGIWTDPFKVNNLRFEPVEEGTKTSGHPEDVFEKGDWVTLGFVEPEKPTNWDEFEEDLFEKEEEILKKAYKEIKRHLEKQGYRVVMTPVPLFYATPEEKPRIWYVVKKNGKEIAYCDIFISYERLEEESEPYAEVSTVCMHVPEKMS